VATSGTTDFDLDIDAIILDSLDMVGGQPTLGYDGRQARRALNLLLTEWQNREIFLWKIPGEPIETSIVEGTTTYTLDASYIDIVDLVIREDDQDLPLQRLSLSQWLQIPNKEQTGRPTQYVVNRQKDAVEITFWPTPNAGDYSMVYWPFTRLEDVTNMTQNADVPFRFLPALTAGLAYYLAFRRPGVTREKREELKILYEQQLSYAVGEDRERVTLQIIPKVGTL
jgi:hypothetical protein